MSMPYRSARLRAFRPARWQRAFTGSRPCCRGSSGRRCPMDDLKAVWKTQPVEDGMITLTDARARADKFQSRVRLRNVVFYVYALFNIAVSIWLIASGGRWSAFLYPMLLMIAAHLWVRGQGNRYIVSQ